MSSEQIVQLGFLFLTLGTWVLIFRHTFRQLNSDDKLTFRHWISGNLRFESKTNHRVDLIFRFVGYGTPVFLVFAIFVLAQFRSSWWTDGTDNHIGLISLIIGLISVEAMFILYALQPKVAVPVAIPLLSAQESRHRRVLTWTSLSTLVCVLNVILRWAPSQEKWQYLIGLSPFYLSYAVIVLRLYRGKFRNGLNLAIAMGCAFVIPGFYLIRYVIRWEKNWWVLGNLGVATLLQPLLVVVATKALIGMPRSSKRGIKSLGSFAYGALLFGVFWTYYSPVPRHISANEFSARMYLSQCDTKLFYYSDEHDHLFPMHFASSESNSKCIPNAPSVIVFDKSPDLSNPIDGYVFEYSGNGMSRSADGCPGFEMITMTARPVVYGKTGIRSFTITGSFETMSMHATSENRPATANDPIFSFPLGRGMD